MVIDAVVIDMDSPNANEHLLNPFEVCVLSGHLAVRQALAGVFAGLKKLSLAAEESGTIELVLAEALNNIVEHAYPGQRDLGRICIRCCHKDNGLHFTLSDHGVPMPDGTLPAGQLQEPGNDPLSLAEGGFGWFLIKGLATDLRYQRIGNENRLELHIAAALRQPRN